MDTSILHTRIKEFKEKAKHPVSKDMISLFEAWLMPIENYLSSVELDNFALNKKITDLEETISILADLLIISGNAGNVFTLNLKDPYVKQAINLLLIGKDRKNFDEIATISTLLYIHSDRKFKTLHELKKYITEYDHRDNGTA